MGGFAVITHCCVLSNEINPFIRFKPSSHGAVLTPVTARLVLLSSLFFFDAVPVQQTNPPRPFIRQQHTMKNDWRGLHSSRSEHIQHRGSEPNTGPLSGVKTIYPSSCKTCCSEMVMFGGKHTAIM